MPYPEKLLSHRLRGFGEFEHTPSAFAKACASGVRYLEIDTRADREGRLFVWHDTRTTRYFNRVEHFATSPRASLDQVRFRNGEPLLTLEEAVRVFRDAGGPLQHLCIDIKDYGFEQQHLDIVRADGMEERVVFVSWIPQSIMRLAEIGTVSPLILSMLNVLRLRYPGKLLAALCANQCVRFRDLVLLGRNRCFTPLGPFAHGYQHGLLSDHLPAAMVDVLRAHRGGLCVHSSAVCNALTEYTRQAGLQLWVFGVNSPDQFLFYARNSGVDVIFAENALECLG